MIACGSMKWVLLNGTFFLCGRKCLLQTFYFTKFHRKYKKWQCASFSCVYISREDLCFLLIPQSYYYQQLKYCKFIIIHWVRSPTWPSLVKSECYWALLGYLFPCSLGPWAGSSSLWSKAESHMSSLLGAKDHSQLVETTHIPWFSSPFSNP